MKKKFLLLLLAALLTTTVLSGCRGKKAGATSSASSLNGSSKIESELFSSNGTDSETKLSSGETQSLFKTQKGNSSVPKSSSASSNTASKNTSRAEGAANAGNLDKDGDGWTDGWN